jgi:hypothetical protein
MYPDFAVELNHIQPALVHASGPSSLPADPDVIMKEPIAHLTPISASKKAQARFASVLIDLATPAFATVTSTVLPLLQSLTGISSSESSICQLPSVPQPCSEACIPLVINPLAQPPAIPLPVHAGDQAPPVSQRLKRRNKFVSAPDLVHAESAKLEPRARPQPHLSATQPLVIA